MRFLRFTCYLIIFIILSFCLTGCCYLSECWKQKTVLPERMVSTVVNTAVHERQDFPPVLYTISGNYTYKHGNRISSKTTGAFLVVDNSNVDPPLVRSKPKTFISVPVAPFHKSIPRRENIVIYFGFDLYEISKTECKKLHSLIKSYKHQPVSVIGYTCWKGSKKYNDILALKRARSVAEYLKKMGIVIKVVKGKGKSQFKSKIDITLNRRVEVIPCAKKSS